LNRVNLVFLCNFKPKRTLLKNTFKKRIFCKNFIIFIMFLKFFKILNSTVFIKPLKKKSLAVLKAPHRFKTSRHLIVFSRYSIVSTFNISSMRYYLRLSHIIIFFKNILLTLRKIDSSLCYQKVIRASFIFSYKKIFH